jgi:hypothetical protein
MTDELGTPLTRPCHYCSKPVDPKSRFTWHRITGWERPGRAGGSDIANRERDGDVFACDRCVRDVQLGRIPQETLL